MTDREQHITEFYNAPPAALFTQITIAHLMCCSEGKLERNRWAGTGIPYIKLSRQVRYKKSDVLEWLGKQEAQQSTSATKNQAA